MQTDISKDASYVSEVVTYSKSVDRWSDKEFDNQPLCQWDSSPIYCLRTQFTDLPVWLQTESRVSRSNVRQSEEC